MTVFEFPVWLAVLIAWPVVLCLGWLLLCGFAARRRWRVEQGLRDVQELAARRKLYASNGRVSKSARASDIAGRMDTRS